MNAPDPDPRGVQQVWLAQDGRPERQFQVVLKRENLISSFYLMLYIKQILTMIKFLLEFVLGNRFLLSLVLISSTLY